VIHEDDLFGPLLWLDYDPRHDVLYLMKMGSDLFKLPRGP
jgi:hypothetical protein